MCIAPYTIDKKASNRISICFTLYVCMQINLKTLNINMYPNNFFMMYDFAHVLHTIVIFMLCGQ